MTTVRVPAGVPTGGQFSPSAHAEPTVALDTSATPAADGAHTYEQAVADYWAAAGKVSDAEIVRDRAASRAILAAAREVNPLAAQVRMHVFDGDEGAPVCRFAGEILDADGNTLHSDDDFTQPVGWDQLHDRVDEYGDGLDTNGLGDTVTVCEPAAVDEPADPAKNRARQAVARMRAAIEAEQAELAATRATVQESLRYYSAIPGDAEGRRDAARRRQRNSEATIDAAAHVRVRELLALLEEMSA